MKMFMYIVSVYFVCVRARDTLLFLLVKKFLEITIFFFPLTKYDIDFS